jgi:chorismate synthase
MAGNTIGTVFKITTFGESHGKAIGATIDGCPAGLKIDLDFIQNELDRRKPGQSKIVTARAEEDKVEILSGVFEGKSTGTPIQLLIWNKDQKSKDYSHIKDSYRPSHADYTYDVKYGHRDYRGGGRSSARETAARVAAGAIAKLLLAQENISITAFVDRVQDIAIPAGTAIDFENIEKNIVRCPDVETAEKMEARILEIKKAGDTVGGSIKCYANNVPVGLGEPVFDRLNADLAKAITSINACKYFTIGSGIEGTFLKGSEHNDAFENKGGNIGTKTNNSGGIQGGISNGETIIMEAGFKPVATLIQTQNSVNKDGNAIEVMGKGRHDPCVLPRAVPIVEAMTALVLADHYLRNKLSQV